jgi:hypothetical protein
MEVYLSPMKFGRIVGILVVLMALAGIGAGAWYWSTHISNPSAAKAQPDAESDSSLAQHAGKLSDSLRLLDMAIRTSQQSDSEVSVELIRRQSELWSRYTWAKSRLSDAVDSRLDTSKKAEAKSSSFRVFGDADGLGAALGSLAIYLWILVGVVVLLVVVFAWWLFGRRPTESHAPLTEPTMTRMDRNVRMPIPGARPAGRSAPPPAEATFSQRRAARLTATEVEDEVGMRPSRGLAGAGPEIPAAPLPKTGRHEWENTTSQPSNNLPSPAEPTVVQDYVVSMAKRGRTSSEIARRLRIPQDQVDLILKLRRNG